MTIQCKSIYSIYRLWRATTCSQRQRTENPLWVGMGQRGEMLRRGGDSWHRRNGRTWLLLISFNHISVIYHLSFFRPIQLELMLRSSWSSKWLQVDRIKRDGFVIDRMQRRFRSTRVWKRRWYGLVVDWFGITWCNLSVFRYVLSRNLTSGF
jgi:hypothetical protein